MSAWDMVQLDSAGLIEQIASMRPRHVRLGYGHPTKLNVSFI